MAEETSSIHNRLATLEHLGEGTVVAEQVFEMVGHSPFFAELDREDVMVLAGFMQVYRARLERLLFAKETLAITCCC